MSRVAPRARFGARRGPGGLAMLVLLARGTCACGSEPSGASNDGAPVPKPDLPYATSVVSFDPGEGAGFGQSKLPGVVLGPPSGNGTGAGSLDVLSLGKGGTIVLGFDPFVITDGEGADLVVFENAFWPDGDPAAVFAEPGEVSVSDDGQTWFTFPCDAAGDGAGHFAGCAGVTPTEKYDARAVVPLDPALTGGDAFDLADLGVARARFVKVHDLANDGSSPVCRLRSRRGRHRQRRARRRGRVA